MGQVITVAARRLNPNWIGRRVSFRSRGVPVAGTLTDYSGIVTRDGSLVQVVLYVTGDRHRVSADEKISEIPD